MGEFLLTISLIALAITFCYVYIKEKLIRNPLNYGESNGISTQAAKEKESYYNTRYISDNGEIFRFLRYRRTPLKDDIKPKKLSFDGKSNVNYFGDYGNNEKFLFTNKRQNSRENNGYLSDYNSSNVINRNEQLNTHKGFLSSKSRINKQIFLNENLNENSDLKTFHENNYNDYDCWHKRNINTNNSMKLTKYNTALWNQNSQINSVNDYPSIHLNLQKNNFEGYNQHNNFYENEIAGKEVSGNRGRKTLDDNYFRRSNLVRANSNVPSSLNNYFYLRKPRNTFANKNSFENLNRNVQSNRYFVDDRYLDLPDQTPNFGFANNNYNVNFDNNIDGFNKRFEFAYTNPNNNVSSNNLNYNREFNNYIKNNNHQKYLEDTASEDKQNEKFRDNKNLKITPVTVNKFYSINNINITNTNTTNNLKSNNKSGMMSKHKRGMSLDNNNFPNRSRNNFNDIDFEQPKILNNSNAIKNQARNNNINNPGSYLKQFPVRKLDFKDESNIKFNEIANLKASDNKSFKWNESVNFSDIRFQSCKSKME